MKGPSASDLVQFQRQPVRKALFVLGVALGNPVRGAFADGDQTGFHAVDPASGRRRIPFRRGRFIGRRGSVAFVRIRLRRSEEHTSELQSLMRISYAVFCLKKKKNTTHVTDKSMKHQEST